VLRYWGRGRWYYWGRGLFFLVTGVVVVEPEDSSKCTVVVRNGERE
jgi:hypothetical protein